MSVVGRLFVAMLREEWRMHSHLFGGPRFAGFPAFIALAGAATVWALTATGTGVRTIVGGAHVLVLLFGLQTGTVGLVGRDVMRNLLGDVSLLLFAGRTLPISMRGLLGVFLAKDALYYALLFVAPITLALAPALPLDALPLLWVTLVMTFVLGATVTLTALSLLTRGVPGWAIGGVLLGVGVVLWLARANVGPYTPLGLFEAPSLHRAVVVLGTVALFTAVGVLGYDPEYVRPSRTAANTYAQWHDRWPTDDPLVAKTLLDVARSSGGFWKVGVSAAILLAVSVFLVDLVGQITGVSPRPGIAYGCILALTAFTTYNWLTQYDDVSFYQRYPIPLARVFDAKAWTFLALGLPVSIGFFVLAAWWQGASLLDALAGFALLVGLQPYLFGLTVTLAGFDPNEFLFDTARFALFTLGIALVLVPLLIAAIAIPTVQAVHAAGFVAVALGAGAAGVVLYRRAIPHWSERLRNG
jgi:hypothetical protein